MTFIPISPQFGIHGTSYRIQYGWINGKLASRLLKDYTVIDSYIYKDEDLIGGIPNPELTIGWLTRMIPNIDPSPIMRSFHSLIRKIGFRFNEKVGNFKSLIIDPKAKLVGRIDDD